MCVYLNTKEVFIAIPDDYKPEEFEGSPIKPALDGCL